MFAMDEDRAFLRSLARKVSRGREVEVTTMDGGVVTGYITGVDREFLMITSRPDNQEVIVSRASLATMAETGRSYKNLPYNDRELVEQYTHTLSKKAKDYLSEQQD